LRVRRWVIAAVVLVCTGAALGLSMTQKPRYEASSQVLISRTNLGNVLTGTPDPTAQEFDFNRIIQTQANLARVPRVAQRTLQSIVVTDRTPQDFLDSSQVTTDPNTDILTLTVQDGDRRLAVRLASAYAREFVGYKRDATVNRLEGLQKDLEAELETLKPLSALAAQDRAQLRRIRNLISLGDSSTSVVQTAREARQIQPTPLRTALLGALLGLMLGIALAFFVDLLDTRLRRSEEIEEALGLPLLGRLSAPPRALRKKDRIVTLEQPDGPDAEAFRVLRTNLAFADIDRRARSIVVSSAIQGEGKSTTVANLAVTLATAGRRVILVDLDFRRPYVERFFGLPISPGATDVILGEAQLDDALATIKLRPGPAKRAAMPAGNTNGNGHAAGNGHSNGNGNGNGHANGNGAASAGSLKVLTAGELPPNVGEFVSSAALRGLLDTLRDRCDVLLMDTPPMLQVGDAIALTQHVDALVLVARLGVVRRQMVDEVKRTLEASPVAVLGVVITDAGADGASGGYGYGYGYGDYYERPASQGRRISRSRSRV
jgi:succinoglycan biosynthesis transport protein ExoP